MQVKVKVNNIISNPFKYVVARLIGNELWYYSTWKTRLEAEINASEFENGIVLEIEENKNDSSRID